MIEKLKLFLFEKFAGKILARLAVTIAAALTHGPVAAFLAKIGIAASVNDAELTAGLIALGHAGFEWFKARSLKKPEPAASGSALPSTPPAQ